MKKHIIEENGISYTLGTDGMYYPDLVLPEGTDYPIGKYGMLRAEYIKKHRQVLCMELQLSGRWNEYLHGIDMECNQRMEMLVEQMKTQAGVTEQLKMQNQMKWVRMMNSIRHSAEEIVLEELVYC